MQESTYLGTEKIGRLLRKFAMIVEMLINKASSWIERQTGS